MRADVAELVHGGETAQEDVIAQVNVTCQRGIVGQDDVVAQLAIVGQVDVGHDPVVVADAGGAGPDGATVEGDEFADGVAVTDLDVVGSPAYFLSCGAAPMEANWKISLSRPMLVWPSMTTCGPMRVPAPMRTSGPMTA
jgi:hypothetical protein